MAEISLPGLDPDKFYYVQIKTITDDRESPWSSIFVFKTIKDTVAPAPITGLTLVPSGTSFSAAWTPPTTDAAGNSLLDLKDYAVTWSADYFSKTVYSVAPSAQLSFEDNVSFFGGSAHGTVTVTVQARDNGDNLSTPVSATVQNPPPAAPTNVVATAGPGQITFTWNPNTTDSDFDHFEIYASTTSGFTPAPTNRVWTGNATTGIFSTSTFLPFYYVVRAVDVMNSYADTTGGPVTPIDYYKVDNVAPNPPAGVTVATALDTSVPSNSTAYLTASWTLNSEIDMGGYKVRYSKSSGGPWDYIDVDRGVSSVRIDNVRANTNYYVGVSAYDINGNTSAFTSATPYPKLTSADVAPATPTGLVASGAFTSLTAYWNRNAETSVESYDVELDTSTAYSGANYKSLNTTANVISFSSLTSGTSYYIRIRAVNASAQKSAWLQVGPTSVGTAVATKTDGAAPTTSPTPTVSGMIQAVEVKWAAISNPDLVTYEVHLSATTGFTPSGATKASETPGTSAIIRTLPGTTTPLAYGTTYYVKIVARDADGSAPAGTQVSGTTLQTTTADINFNARSIGSTNVYRQGTTPTPPAGGNLVGDLWYDTSQGNKPKVWDGTTWVDSHDTAIDTASTAAAAAQTAANNAQGTANSATTIANGKITTFYTGPTPSATAIGDLWVNTADANKSYRASAVGTGNWVYIADTRIAQGLADAAAAQTTANSKISTYYQTTQPTGGTYAVGDLWVDTDDGNRVYRYNGTTWISTQFGFGAIADYSISGVKIIAGAVTAEKLSQVAFSDQAQPNASFEDLDVTTGLPARWTFDTTTGYTGATYATDTTVAKSGARSVKMTNTTNQAARIYSGDILPVTAGELWYLATQTYSASATTGSAVSFDAYFYGPTGTYLSTVNIGIFDSNPSWVRKDGQVTVPVGATGMRAAVGIRQNVTVFSVNVDVIEVRKVVTGVVIQDGAVDAQKIKAQSILATNIAANGISADRLAIGSLPSILVLNGSFESALNVPGKPDAWDRVEGLGVIWGQSAQADSPSGDNVLSISGATNTAIGSQPFPVKPGSTYSVRYWVKHTDGTGNRYARINYSATLPNTVSFGTTPANYITANNRAGFNSLESALTNSTITSWTLKEFTWVAPANVYWASVAFYNWAASTGQLYVDDVDMREQVSSTQIADGIITTAKVVAGGLAADVITTGFLSGARVSAGTLDANTLQANTAFTNNLTVSSQFTLGTSAVNPGTIQSFNYNGSTSGFKLTSSGLDIRSGTVSAKALQIQTGPNLVPPEVSTFSLRPTVYTNGNFISWSTDVPSFSTGPTTGYPMFGPQSLQVYRPAGGTFANITLASNSTTYNIKIDPLVTYIVSYYALVPAGNPGSITSSQVKFSDGSVVSFATGSSVPTQATPTRISGTITAPANVTGAQIILNFGSNGSTYYLGGFQVEQQTGSLTTPSTYSAPGLTSIDGGNIRTGAIQSSLNASNGQPSWSINMAGDAQFSNAKVLGSIVVGDTGFTSSSTSIQSSGYSPGSVGWAIKADGTVDFKTGNFRGDITGASGTFSGALTVGSGNTVFKVDSVGNMWAGNNAYASAPFRVSNTGVLYATGATISGAITANSLSTGGFTINSDGSASSTNLSWTNTGVLTTYSATLNGGLTINGGSANFYANSNGIYLGSGSPTSANFWVDSGGNLTAKSGTFTGTVNATGGTFSGTVYGGTFSGGLFTGSTFQTASSGYRVVMSQNSDGITFMNGGTTYGSIVGISGGNGMNVRGTGSLWVTPGTTGSGTMVLGNPLGSETTYINGASIRFESTPAVGAYPSGVYTPVSLQGHPHNSIQNLDSTSDAMGLGYRYGDSKVRIYRNTGTVDFAATQGSTLTGSKTFVIQHPTRDDKYLVHAVSEGPTADVHYRGIGRLEQVCPGTDSALWYGECVIVLPDYFEALTNTDPYTRNVSITPIPNITGCDCSDICHYDEGWKGMPVAPNIGASKVEDGKFVVYTIGGWNHHCAEFYWEVKASRRAESFETEPNKSDYSLHGNGPYTYLVKK